MPSVATRYSDQNDNFGADCIDKKRITTMRIESMRTLETDLATASTIEICHEELAPDWDWYVSEDDDSYFI